MPLLIILGSIIPLLSMLTLDDVDIERESSLLLMWLYYCSPITTYYFVTYNILYNGLI